MVVVGGGRYIVWKVPGSDPGCVVWSWGGVRGGEGWWSGRVGVVE